MFRQSLRNDHVGGARSTLRGPNTAFNFSCCPKRYPEVVPAGTIHFDGAEQDTMIIGTAIGPWRTNTINADSPTSAGTPKPD